MRMSSFGLRMDNGYSVRGRMLSDTPPASSSQSTTIWHVRCLLPSRTDYSVTMSHMWIMCRRTIMLSEVPWTLSTSS